MKWGPWSDWSSCSRLCDAGVRHRSRSCLNGDECVGKKKEESGCMLQKCPGELKLDIIQNLVYEAAANYQFIDNLFR